MCLILVFIYVLYNLIENQLPGVFQRAGQKRAGGLLVASAAELGGDPADVKPTPASKRASDSTVLELDE